MSEQMRTPIFASAALAVLFGVANLLPVTAYGGQIVPRRTCGPVSVALNGRTG